MRQPKHYPVGRRIAAVTSSLLLVGLAAGVASGHTVVPQALSVTHDGLGVSVSAGWTNVDQDRHYVGWAVDWGDLSSGNDLQAKKSDRVYHIGDGTDATNVVLHDTPVLNTDAGTLTVSHSYATAGTYEFCVIMYDLGPNLPAKAEGEHGLKATGDRHNTDNGVENVSMDGAGVRCGSVTVGNATTEPTDATTEPTDGTSEPTDATSEPTDATKASPSASASSPSSAPTQAGGQTEASPSAPASSPSSAPTQASSATQNVAGATARASQRVAGATSVNAPTPPATSTAAVPAAASTSIGLLLLLLALISLGSVLSLAEARRRR